MRQYFCVGFASNLYTFLFQQLLDRNIIFDDTVAAQEMKQQKMLQRP